MMKRIAAIMALSCLMIGGLLLRAAYVQVYQGPDLTRRASNEHSRQVTGLPERGLILDRYGNTLAGAWPTRCLVADHGIIPQAITEAERRAGQKPGTYLQRWVQAIDRGSSSVVLDTRAGEKPGLQQFNLPGLRLINAYTRYRQPPLAPHLIGYTTMAASKDNKTHGATGVEMKYDNWLSRYPEMWRELIDGRGNTIPGLSSQQLQAAGQPAVVLTLDRRLQALTQQVIANSGAKRGAVVVLDVVTRDVLALASFPEFEPETFYAGDPGDNPYINRALLPYHPGSLFKVVVAAAVLENKLNDESVLYRCPGYYTFPSGVTIRCWKKEGHGLVSFDQGLALSCNSTFIQIGQLAGRKRLLQEAAVLHLTENRITGFEGVEEKGLLKVEAGGPALANACLGQQGVLLTPLQIANLMATVADNGWWRPPRLVLEQRQGDSLAAQYRQPPARQVISTATSTRLQEMLRSVVDDGTGKRADGLWAAAGKTASSEAPGNVLHTWFAGYVPAEKPRIAIAVLVEQGASGGTTCAPIFKAIADGAAKIYNW
ncbi:MAG: peptidoglycan D,D-transpeptidase FtsI family protein [Methylocystaceae bacterium]